MVMDISSEFPLFFIGCVIVTMFCVCCLLERKRKSKDRENSSNTDDSSPQGLLQAQHQANIAPTNSMGYSNMHVYNGYFNPNNVMTYPTIIRAYPNATSNDVTSYVVTTEIPPPAYCHVTEPPPSYDSLFDKAVPKSLDSSSSS